MSDGKTDHPDPASAQEELRAISVAMREIARRVVAHVAKLDEHGAPLSAVRLLAPRPSTRLGALAVLLPDADAGTIFRALVAAELEPAAYRALIALSPSDGERNVTNGALVTLGEELGIPGQRTLAAVAEHGPLHRWGLIEIEDATTPLVSRRLAVAERVLRHILDALEDQPDDLPLARVKVPEVAAAPDALRELFADLESRPIWVVGAPGSGRRAAIAAVAAERRLATLTLPFDDTRRWAPRELMRRLWREVLLQRAIICITDVDVADPAAEPDPATLQAAVVAAHLPAVFTSAAAPPLRGFDEPPAVVAISAAHTAT